MNLSHSTWMRIGSSQWRLRPSAAVQVIPPAQAATSAPHQRHHHLTTTLPFHPQPYRAIKKMVKGFPRPLLNLSTESFAKVINDAFGEPLSPPFDPYANDINYLISCYIIPYVGLTGYVGANPKLQNPLSRKLVAGLLGVESGQDAVIRSLLYERAQEKVIPYDMTVAEFTNKISGLRNKLGKSGVKDEGLVVSVDDGAEKRIEGNVLAGDEDSLAYGRTPQEILRIVYGSGAEDVPGGFYPNGGDGAIAKRYLKRGR